MKSVLVIGLGRFGRHFAKRMTELGNDVMVIDSSPEVIEHYSDSFTDAQIGDCTNEWVIKSLGVDHFDICVVAIGDNFQSSLVVSSLLKQFGAKYVIAKATQDIQGDLLQKIGADEIVYAERDIAEKLAIKHNATNIFDFIKLTDDYAIFEIPVPAAWLGKTVAEIDIRRKYSINIIAMKEGNSLKVLPGADYRFAQGDHMVVVGRGEDVFKLSSKT